MLVILPFVTKTNLRNYYMLDTTLVPGVFFLGPESIRDWVMFSVKVMVSKLDSNKKQAYVNKCKCVERLFLKLTE